MGLGAEVAKGAASGVDSTAAGKAVAVEKAGEKVSESHWKVTLSHPDLYGGKEVVLGVPKTHEGMDIDKGMAETVARSRVQADAEAEGLSLDWDKFKVSAS